jgi:rhodanese-related sulfurtransferase
MMALFYWLLLGLPAQAGPAEVALAAMKPVITMEHPSVKWVDAAGLEKALSEKAQSTASPPLLVDVRTEAEWKEGHLPGAVRIPHDAPELPAELTRDLAQPIVVYCAVGVRSAWLAERLQGDGYTHVQNLEGGIFAWANAGLPMVKDAAPTTTVHPYDATWGKMLAPEHRADAEPIQ